MRLFDETAVRLDARARAAALLRYVVPIVCLALIGYAGHLVNSDRGGSLAMPGGEWLAKKLVIDIRDFPQALTGYIVLVISSVVLALTLRDFWPRRAASDVPAAASKISLPWRRPAFVAAVLLSSGTWTFLVIESAGRHYEWYYPILLLAAAAVPSFALFGNDRRRGVSFHCTVTKAEIIGLATIVVLAGLVLSFDLTMTPDSFWPDEGSFWTEVLALGKDHQRLDMFAPGVYGFPLASSAYQVLFAKVFGYTVWAWRFSSVFATLLAYVPLYFLARALFDRRVAFGALILMTGSPFLIAFARLGYNNSQSFLPVCLCLLATYLGIERRSTLLLFCAGLAAGLGFYTYFADRFVVVIVALLLLWAGWTRRLSWREAAAGVLLAGAGTVLIGVMPSVRTYAEHSEYLNRKSVEAFWANSFYVQAVYRNAPIDSFPTLKLGEVKLVFDAGIWARLLTRGLIRTLFAFHRDDSIFHHYIHGSLGGPLTSFLVVPGVAFAAVNLRRAGGALTFAWFAAGILALGVVSAFPPAQAHLVPLIPVVAILNAAAVLAFVSWLGRASSVKPLLRDGVATAVLVALAAIGVRHYFQVARNDFPPTTVEAIVGFKAMAAGSGSVSLVYEDPRFEKVPWEVASFDLQGHFEAIPANQMSDPSMLDRLDQSEYVVVEGSSDDRVLRLVQAKLSEWEVSSYRSGSKTVAWVLRPPASRQPEPLSTP